MFFYRSIHKYSQEMDREITYNKYYGIVTLKQPGTSSTHDKYVYNFSRTAVVMSNSGT